MESVNFNYCSSDTIRESPLPFRIEWYPTDRVIDPTGEPISKLSKKIFSLLENKEHDLDSIVLKCQQKFSEKVINGIEKLYNNKRLKSSNKTEVYPEYLWLQMPEGGAHRQATDDLNFFIRSALRARFQDAYKSRADREVFTDQEYRNYYRPDCSFLSVVRSLEAGVWVVPNLLVEVGSSQTYNRLVSKIASWFFIENNLGHVVDMVLGVDMTFVDRDGREDNQGNPVVVNAIYTGRLFSVKFSLFARTETIRRALRDGDGLIHMPELQTIQANINPQRVVGFEPDPDPFSKVRSPNYTHDRENNLHIPFHMLDGVEHDGNLPNILLTAQNMIEIVQSAYVWHEKEISERNIRAQANRSGM